MDEQNVLLKNVSYNLKLNGPQMKDHVFFGGEKRKKNNKKGERNNMLLQQKWVNKK